MFDFGKVGIDIGSETVKAVHMIKKGKKFAIKQMVKIHNNRAPKSVEDLNSKDFSLCINKLKNLLSCKNIITGIPNQCVIVRNAILPMLTKIELEEAIFWETRELLTMFKKDFVYDYEITQKGPDFLKIAIAAADRNYVETYMNVLEAAGFRIIALDIYPLAVARMLKSLGNNMNIAIIDVKDSNCEVIIVEKGSYSLHHNISLNPYDNIEPFKDQKDQTNVQRLAMEISNFFEHYHFKYGNNIKINKVILIADSSSSNIKETCKNFLKVPVVMASDYFKDLKLNNYSGNNIDYMGFINAISFALR